MRAIASSFFAKQACCFRKVKSAFQGLRKTRRFPFNAKRCKCICVELWSSSCFLIFSTCSNLRRPMIAFVNGWWKLSLEIRPFSIPCMLLAASSISRMLLMSLKCYCLLHPHSVSCACKMCFEARILPNHAAFS